MNVAHPPENLDAEKYSVGTQKVKESENDFGVMQ